jgi:hypothetical protein
VPKHDASSPKIVGRQLTQNLIAANDADVMFVHSAGNASNNGMATIKLDLEIAGGKCSDNRAFRFYKLLFHAAASTFHQFTVA